MTDKAFPRERFDPAATYVVNRPILISGEELAPGTTFDKTLVDVRRLRQLYDQRYLRLEEHKVHPKDAIKQHPYRDLPKLNPRPGRMTTEA